MKHFFAGEFFWTLVSTVWCSGRIRTHLDSGFSKFSEMEADVQMYSSGPSDSGYLVEPRYCSMKAGGIDDLVCQAMETGSFWGKLVIL